MYNYQSNNGFSTPGKSRISLQYMLYLLVTYIFNYHKYHVDISTKDKSLETKQKKYLFVSPVNIMFIQPIRQLVFFPEIIKNLF